MEPNSGRNSDPSNHAPDAAAIAWNKFISLFPTEQSCLEELYKRIGKEIKSCSHCHSIQIEFICNHRVIHCRGCNTRTWITAGTFFDRIKKAQAWLGAFWFFEHNVLINPHKFHKLAGVTYAAAYKIFRKIFRVVQDQLLKEEEDTVVLKPPVFTSLFKRRSRETPKRKHPRDDESEPNSTDSSHGSGWFDDDEMQQAGETDRHSHDNNPAPTTSLAPQPPPAPGSTKSHLSSAGKVPGLELNDRQKLLMEHLSREPSEPETLCVKTGIPLEEIVSLLSMLELLGLAQCVNGGRFIRKKQVKEHTDSAQDNVNLDGMQNHLILQFKLFVRTTGSQGISQKYLQNYLAMYWCYSDRVRWRGNALIRACAKYRRFSFMELVNSFSPRIVEMPFRQTR